MLRLDYLGEPAVFVVLSLVPAEHVGDRGGGNLDATVADEVVVPEQGVEPRPRDFSHHLVNQHSQPPIRL